MKNLSTLLLCCTLFTTTYTYAQKGVEVGIRFMPQSTWLFNTADFDEAGERLSHEMTWGTSFGLAAGFNFTDNFGIRTNFLLASQGQKHYGDLTTTPGEASFAHHVAYTVDGQRVITGAYTSEMRLNYFQLPLLLHLNSDPSSGAFFSFLIGPQFNFRTGAAHIVDGTEVDYTEFDFVTEDLYNSTVISLAMGLGADISITDMLKFNINFRFAYDMGDIEDKGFTPPKGTNSTFWHATRPDTRNLTGGVMLGLTYVFEM